MLLALLLPVAKLSAPLILLFALMSMGKTMESIDPSTMEPKPGNGWVKTDTGWTRTVETRWFKSTETWTHTPRQENQTQ